MKRKIFTIAFLAVLVLSLLLLVACNEKKEGENASTTAAQTTAAKTTAAKTTAEPTTEEVTTAVVTTGIPAELKNLMPATLPDGKKYDAAIRVDFSNGDAYTQKRNSGSSVDVIFTQPGIYGTGITLGLSASGTRAEIGIEPNEFVIEPAGCSGIMFYVDFSSTNPNPDKEGCCASVTMEGNTYRANKSGGMSVGYYFQDGVWKETKNVNACRMQLPHQFKGWVYIPATSYSNTTDTSAVLVDDNGNFVELNVFNFYLYTDYYDMSVPVAIVFDEVMWIRPL